MNTSKKISDTLKEAAKKYRETHPITENFRKALRRQYPKLQAEKNILQKELQNKRLAQEFATNFPGADYINTIQGKIDKLQNELDRIKPFIETGQLQPTLP
jgi:uncharacterized coiled-coil DUF342 family protein